jgi:pimeloyl-ACP methyl ester carboxylesterase
MRINSRKTIVSTFMAFALASMVAAAQSPTFTTITGEIGPGALYEIAMPTAPWNGELVVYAHGIVPPTAPIALSNEPKFLELRETLTSQGFALVYSSYSVNGWGGMKDGMVRTHQLRGIFASRVVQPTRVYLVGESMGGLIAVMLVERFPDQYDGALSLCGVLAGGVGTVGYLADARVVFDYFFPGVVPGTLFYVPPGINFDPGGPTYEAVRAALIAGLSSDGQPTLQFAKAAKLPAVGPVEIVTGGMNIVGMTLTQAPNLLDLTNGHMVYDNSGTWYSGSKDDAALNDLVYGVARYVSDPSAINYLEHYYKPIGDLRVPVLTLYTSRDPISPEFHEQKYREVVVNAGADGYLLQREVEAFGHCGLPTFTFPQFRLVTDAFSTLVQWVSTGVKPQN